MVGSAMALAFAMMTADAEADVITFNFNCQMTTNTCGAPFGSYGTLTLTDSTVDPNRVDINLVAIPPAGSGNTLNNFYLNIDDPLLSKLFFYLVTQTAPAGVASNAPYTGFTLGSVQYGNNGVALGTGFLFDLKPDPTNTSLTFAGSLALYKDNTSPTLDEPVNIDVRDFLFTTPGGNPPLYAAYLTNATDTGLSVRIGSASVEIPEPSSILLLATALFGLALRRRRQS